MTATNPNHLPDNFSSSRFLIVDDDKEHLDMLARSLSSMGLVFETAANANQALAHLTAQSFDLVISDIQMPQCDGIELLRLIKKDHPATDVVLMTGYSQTYTFTDVIREGATDYLEKPFTRDAVRAKIFRILNERALLAGYNQELAQRRKMEQKLQRQSADLEKRVRELNCLYRVSNILEQGQDQLEEIFQRTIDAVPSGFQYPDLAAARLCHGDRCYSSPNFRETAWTLTATILSRGKEAGSITVCYLSEIAGTDSPFLQEERALLNLLAERMGRAIDKYRAETEVLDYFSSLEEAVRLRTQELHAAQAALESVFQNIPDGILSVDTELTVTHANGPCAKILTVEIGRPFVPTGDKFQDECRSVVQNTITSREAITDYRIEIQTGDQARKVVLVSTSLLRDADENVSGTLLIIHDITRLADLENQLLERRRFRQLIGNSLPLQEIFAKVRKLASVDTTVLITGESGTGKELLVETLHSSGNRSAKALIRVNCAALSENLLESELFGHVRGAFTGAVKDRTGRIQAAEGGILFLDEIGDISPRIQLKLLRFLEMKEYERVGETRTRKADVRVIAATNADMAQKVRQGHFREDLYYRLKVMVIHLPPLRERMDDLPFLADHFLSSFNSKFQKSITRIAPDALEIMMNYPWPGNIRELKHVIEHAVLLASGQELRPEHLPKDLVSTSFTPLQDKQPARALTRDTLISTLRQTDGNKAKTARLLKLSRATLYNKLKEFNLDTSLS